MSLDHIGVHLDADASAHLDKALRLLLRYKPKDPRGFLALYFDHVVEGVSAVQRAYRLITWASQNPRCSLSMALAESYLVLSVNQKHTLDRPYGSLQMRRKAAAGGKKRRKSKSVSLSSSSKSLESGFERMVESCLLEAPSKVAIQRALDNAFADMSGCDGVQGSHFMQLLGMITCDFSPHVSAAMLEYFHKSERALVTWEFYMHAVSACLSYNKYLAAATNLFSRLDPKCTGYASMVVCQQLVDELLVTSLPPHRGASSTQRTVAESRQRHTGVAAAVAAEVMRQNRGNTQQAVPDHGSVVSLAEFLRSMSAIFIEVLFNNDEPAPLSHVTS